LVCDVDSAARRLTRPERLWDGQLTRDPHWEGTDGWLAVHPTREWRLARPSRYEGTPRGEPPPEVACRNAPASATGRPRAKQGALAVGAKRESQLSSETDGAQEARHVVLT